MTSGEICKRVRERRSVVGGRGGDVKTVHGTKFFNLTFLVYVWDPARFFTPLQMIIKKKKENKKNIFVRRVILYDERFAVPPFSISLLWTSLKAVYKLNPDRLTNGVLLIQLFDHWEVCQSRLLKPWSCDQWCTLFSSFSVWPLGGRSITYI